MCLVRYHRAVAHRALRCPVVTLLEEGVPSLLLLHVAFTFCYALSSSEVTPPSPSLRPHRSSSTVQTIASESSTPYKKCFIHPLDKSVEKCKTASWVQQHARGQDLLGRNLSVCWSALLSPCCNLSVTSRHSARQAPVLTAQHIG